MGYPSRSFTVFLLLATAVTLVGCPIFLSPKGLMPTVLHDSLTVPALRAASVIYVDFSYTGSDSNGTEARPYLNLTQAVNAAASGDTIRIKGGGSTTSSPETLRITKLSRIEASGGAVAIGDATANALVPNVVNMTQAAAQSAITAAGLTVGAVSQQYHATVLSGRVISENPIAGRIVALSSAVALDISKGPEPVAPTISSFRINNGATATASRTVKLYNTCSGGPAQYMASQSSSFTGATWQTYAAVPSFTLSSGDGLKTVYFKVKNTAGTSLPAADTILLQEVAGVSEDTILLPDGVPLTMVWIPAGSFMMGRYTDEYLSAADEDPQHAVSISTGFWLGKYEVTKRQWKAIMGTEPWAGQTQVLDDLDSPAVYVSWDNAQSFIMALNAATDMVFRLPAEAEWEYVCRAGTAWRYYWGDDPVQVAISDYAWWTGNAGGGTQTYAHVVGLKVPNSFGLFDMSGNAGEWCEDDWHYGYVGAPTGQLPWIDNPRAERRVARSGTWRDDADKCRSANRDSYYPTLTNAFVGFRLVK